MKNFFLSILFALSLTLIPGCADRNKTPTTGANVPAGSTVPAKALEQQAVVDKATHADDGSSLKTIAAIDAKIKVNKENIQLLLRANQLLEEQKVEVQEAIDETWLFFISGFFALAAIVLGVVGVVWAPPLTKTFFVKLAVVCGLIAAIATGTAIYLPTIFAVIKIGFVVLGIALAIGGVYYFVLFLKALHAEGSAGSLSSAAESLPIVGKVIADANKTIASSSLTSDISGAKADVNAVVSDVKADEVKAKSFLSTAEASVKSGFARVEAEVKKII